MNFLHLSSSYPLRFVSSDCLSLAFSDSVKHCRAVVVSVLEKIQYFLVESFRHFDRKGMRGTFNLD
jgi:hypothetical protein